MKRTLIVVIYDTNQFFAAGIRQTLIVYCQQRNIPVRFEDVFKENEWENPHLVFIAETLPPWLPRSRDNLMHQKYPRIIQIREFPPRIVYPYDARIMYRRQSIADLSQQLSDILDTHPCSTSPMPTPDTQPLTQQETRVLRYLSIGFHSVLISRYLNISPKTVSYHKRSAMKKLCFSRNIELYHWLARGGLPDVPNWSMADNALKECSNMGIITRDHSAPP